MVSDDANVESWIASWIVVAVAYLYMLSLYPSVCSGIVVGRRLLSFGTCSPPSMNYRLKELSVSTAAGTTGAGVPTAGLKAAGVSAAAARNNVR